MPLAPSSGGVTSTLPRRRSECCRKQSGLRGSKAMHWDRQKANLIASRESAYTWLAVVDPRLPSPGRLALKRGSWREATGSAKVVADNGKKLIPAWVTTGSG